MGGIHQEAKCEAVSAALDQEWLERLVFTQHCLVKQIAKHMLCDIEIHQIFGFFFFILKV